MRTRWRFKLWARIYVSMHLKVCDWLNRKPDYDLLVAILIYGSVTEFIDD